VCTGESWAVALAAGFDPARLWFHGNNKSVAELERAVAAGVRHDRWSTPSRRSSGWLPSPPAPTSVSASTSRDPRLEAHTHEYVQTGQEDQKFGFSLASGAAAEACRRVVTLPSLVLQGIHCHIGSHIFDTHGFSLAAHRMVELLAAVRDEHGCRAA